VQAISDAEAAKGLMLFIYWLAEKKRPRPTLDHVTDTLSPGQRLLL
jgi:hypothetical protein